MCPKHWQRLRCSGPFEATFNTSGPRATVTMKWVGRALLGWVLVATAGSQLCNSLDSNIQGFELISDNALKHFSTQILHQKPHSAVLGSVKLWKLTPPFPSRNRSAMTEAVNPSAVDGMTTNFSPFIWAIRPPLQDIHNQARKERASPKPEIKTGVLLGRSPAGRQILATWTW